MAKTLTDFDEFVKNDKSNLTDFDEFVKSDKTNNKQLPAASSAKKEKSSSILDTAKDFATSYLDSMTYGRANDIIPYLSPDMGEIKDINDKSELAQKDYVKEAEERSPLASKIANIAGFIGSPGTKVINKLGKLGGTLAGKLSKVDNISKSKSLAALAKIIGYSAENVAPGAAMVAAQKGDQGYDEMAMGGAMNAAINKFPLVAGAGLAGQQLADLIGKGEESAPVDIASAAASIAAAKLGKKYIDNRNAKVDPKILKYPLEKLEDAYLKLGQETPAEMRGDKKIYSVPNWPQQSDKVRALKENLDNIKLSLLEDVPEANKKSYTNFSKRLGEDKYDTLREVLADESKANKLMSAIEEMNRENGSNEPAKLTLEKMLDSMSIKNDKVNYNPLNEKVDDIIIGKIRQTPVRFIRGFNNSFGESRYNKDMNPEAIPADMEKFYRDALLADNDVKTGRLTPWLREKEKVGEQNDKYVRLFDPEKPWRLLPDNEAARLTEEGRTVEIGGKRQSKSNQPPALTEEQKQSMLELISPNKNSPRKISDKKALKDLIDNNADNEKVIEYNKAFDTLANMTEGRRQMQLEQKDGSLTGKVLKKAMDYIVPGSSGGIDFINEKLPSSKLEEYHKNFKKIANQYGKGKSIENMPEELRPKLIRINELAKRNDSIGKIFKEIKSNVDEGNIDNAMKYFYYYNSIPEMKGIIDRTLD